MKNFVEKLKKDNRYITCNITSNCMEHVKNGNAAYSAVLLLLFLEYPFHADGPFYIRDFALSPFFISLLIP